MWRKYSPPSPPAGRFRARTFLIPVILTLIDFDKPSTWRKPDEALAKSGAGCPDSESGPSAVYPYTNGAEGGNRTRDLSVKFMEPTVGLEPTTCGLRYRCSTR